MTLKILIILSAFMALTTTPSVSDKVDITGHWEGTITRDEGGGKRTTFEMRLDVLQRGKKITGISYAGFENDNKKYFAKFDITGKISGSYFKFTENKILNADSIPHATWCIKKADLIYRKPKDVETLEGIWEGVAEGGECMPGRIFLQKKPPRV